MVEKNLIIDNIYISPYEKYAVLYANTFITIFDMEENKLFRVNMKYVSNTHITYDNQLLIGSTTGSNIFIYDLKEKNIILKKTVSRQHYVSLIQQFNNDKIFILCDSYCNKDILLCVYDIEKKKLEKINKKEIKHIDKQVYYHKGRLIFKLDVEIDLQNKKNKYCSYYEIDENYHLKKYNHLDFMVPNKTLTFSRNGYYCIEYKKNLKLEKSEYDISVFDLKNDIVLWQVKNVDCRFGIRKGEKEVSYSKFAIGYFGEFIGDLILDKYDKPVLYRYSKNIIEIYYLTEGKKYEIKFDDDTNIGVCRLSIKNDYVIVQLDNFWKYPVKGKGYIYNLSTLLENNGYKLI